MDAGKQAGKNAIWLVILITLLMIATTGWLFHHHVSLIDRELENIRKNESR